MGLMTYILLGISGILAAFAMVILIAMVSYDNKSSKINRKVSGLTTTTTRHWESIRILSELHDQLDEKVREQGKDISALTDKVNWLEKDAVVRHYAENKEVKKRQQLPRRKSA